MVAPGSGKVKMVFEHANGDDPISKAINTFEGLDVHLTMINTEESITDIARSQFSDKKIKGYPVIIYTNNTVLKIQRHAQRIFEEKSTDFRNLPFEHRLIDKGAPYMVKSDNGYIMALNHYDGDVISDIFGKRFGRLELMRSVVLCRHDNSCSIETEAAQRKLSRHYQ